MMRMMEIGGTETYCVPKMLYVHYIKVPGSLMNTWFTTTQPIQREFWLDKARSEYLYSMDREIEYSPNKPLMVVNQE